MITGSENKLDLGDQKITDVDLRRIVCEIENPEKITAFDLSFNELTDISPIQTLSPFMELVDLEELDVSCPYKSLCRLKSCRKSENCVLIVFKALMILPFIGSRAFRSLVYLSFKT